MAILRSIIEGERDPKKLAAHRSIQCKASTELFVESLKGQYRPEHIFSLKQAVSIYDTYQDKISECDQEIEKLLEKHKKKKSDDNDDKQEPHSKKKKSNSKNGFEFDLGKLLMDMTGVDLTRIDGISPNNALTIIAEIGLDMSCWENEKHFSSWLDLSPGNRKSGGKQLSGKTRKNANRAAKAFRLAAMTLHKSQSSLGSYFRRMRSKKGSPKAITAAAHKIAKLFYSVLKYGKEYLDKGMEHYEKQFEAKRLKFLEKQARQFGCTLTPVGV
jgi:transposase